MKKVAIFGSSRTEPGELYDAVERLGKRCAQSGWTVVTGGGPGTMEAANKGAASVDLTRSEAEAIYLPFEEQSTNMFMTTPNIMISSLDWILSQIVMPLLLPLVELVLS